jgi:hypothetical protein
VTPRIRIGRGALAAGLLVATVGGGCTTRSPAASPTPVPTAAAASTPAAIASPTTSPSPAATLSPTGAPTQVPTEAPTQPPIEGPPAASLAAEGGDPVVGQLGTYTWADGGSDAPWLPGAPISVGTGEPLVVRLEPATNVDAWRARIVSAGSSGPAGATVLGEGSGPPTFATPERGAWTLEVQVTFADGRGMASYAWALTVT